MDHTKNLKPLLIELRERSEKQPGYISRNTYSNVSDPGELIVIAQWETIDDWMNFMNQKESKELQWKIDSIIGEKTIFDVYMAEDF